MSGKGKGKVVPVLNYPKCHEGTGGSGSIAPGILNFNAV
jgi:hypothetical protein